jgi:hypothetical protein
MIDGWDNSDEKQQLSQAMAEAREKPPAKTLLDKKWKPPGWWVQVWVLTVRRLNTIINDRQHTFAPLVVFFILGFIISTYGLLSCLSCQYRCCGDTDQRTLVLPCGLLHVYLLL